MSNKLYTIAREKFNGIQATIYNRRWNTRDHCREPELYLLFDVKTDWKYEPKSNIDRSKTLNQEVWSGKGIITASAAFKEKYESAKSRIIDLCENSEDEFPPNQVARHHALFTLDLLKEHEMVPSLINSTDDNSLIFEFFVGDKFFLIEFYNSGEIVYLRRIEGKPKFVIEATLSDVSTIIRDITY